MTTRIEQKRQRAQHVNVAIRIIASHGRRFFYCSKHDRTATLEVDERGRIWFVDDYTGLRVYTHYPYGWKHFSHGGTLRRLIEVFRDYISTGRPICASWLGPEKSWSAGNVWGYEPEAMQAVRDAALQLPIFQGGKI
jgi:hypothetical protein